MDPWWRFWHTIQSNEWCRNTFKAKSSKKGENRQIFLSHYRKRSYESILWKQNLRWGKNLEIYSHLNYLAWRRRLSKIIRICRPRNLSSQKLIWSRSSNESCGYVRSPSSSFSNKISKVILSNHLVMLKILAYKNW